MDGGKSGGGSVTMESTEIPQPQPVAVLSGNVAPPFLSKTYDMVDDPSTDPIVSGSANSNSFIVWDPPQFAQVLLPKYFNHNNLSSFIRKLNTYGFWKVDPDRWDFANEVGKFGLEEEVERLKRDKNVLMQELVRLRQPQQFTDNNLQTIVQRLQGMENRQQQLMRINDTSKKRRFKQDGIVTRKDSDGQLVKYQPPMHEQAKAMLKQLMKMEPYKTGDDGFLLGDGSSTTTEGTEMEISSNNVSGMILQEMPTASDIQS
ncbi:Heat stress transcription factor A-1d [Raphanus sativus]|nr:Heat stress transcription factor A-1d [Raphanus sativus]